jgi:hypothetical protein
MFRFIPLTNSESFAAVGPADYELVRHLQWHLEEEGWAATELNGELIEMGIYIKRARGEAPLSPAPWRDQLN